MIALARDVTVEIDRSNSQRERQTVMIITPDVVAALEHYLRWDSQRDALSKLYEQCEEDTSLYPKADEWSADLNADGVDVLDALVAALRPALVKVHIEWAYESGHEYKRDVLVAAPDEDDILDLSEWWNDRVWEHTGDGITEDIGSVHDATITEAADSKLVGQTYGWGC